MEDIKEQVINYLSKRKFITLATSSINGEPLTHPVAYVNNGANVFISTNKKSRKVKNIIQNPKVAYSVYDQTENLDEIRSIQMEGKATLIEEQKEIIEITKKLHKKFPFMVDIPIDSDTIIIKITPKTCFFSDYNKSFGNIEKIDF